MNELMTRETLRLKLDVSKSTIIRWQNQGMPVIKIGKIVRYDYEDVMKWIRETI